MGYPDRESERTILRSHGMRRTDVEQVLTLEEVHELIEAAEAVKVHEDLENYILALVEKTRGDERLLRGVSTRGADALYRACRALALARGRAYAIPEDVRDLAVPVLAHRVMARTDGGSVSREGAGRTIREILWDLPAPS
jgi:MoxR-like ATPase